MKIKYRNETLSPNQSKYCIDCAIYKYVGIDGSCFGLCSKTKVFGGFNMINDCEILELWKLILI